MRAHIIMKQRGFSLLEVLVALAIALMMLTALLSLEMKSTALAARTSMGINTLPIAIEKIEELIEREASGKSEEKVREYKVVTEVKEVLTGVNMVRIKVEVLFNEEPCCDLSIYKFR